MLNIWGNNVIAGWALVMSTISKRKQKCFDIEAYYRIWSSYNRNKTKTFWFGPLTFGTKSERFCLLQTAQESKQNVCILKKWKQNETKTFQIAPGFFKDKTKLLIVSRNFWKLTRTKAFEPKFSSTDRKCFVPIQIFVSKTNLFDLFWNKSRKTKAFDLERTLIWHCYTRQAPPPPPKREFFCKWTKCHTLG